MAAGARAFYTASIFNRKTNYVLNTPRFRPSETGRKSSLSERSRLINPCAWE
jgi:hypothetical protein